MAIIVFALEWEEGRSLRELCPRGECGREADLIAMGSKVRWDGVGRSAWRCRPEEGGERTRAEEGAG